MRHRNKGKILDRKKEPREMMLRNMISSLLIYERIETTLAKAKVLRPLAEKAITTAKKGDIMHSQADISLAKKEIEYFPKFGLDRIKQLLE